MDVYHRNLFWIQAGFQANRVIIIIFDNDQTKNVALEFEEVVRYLGIIIDNNLFLKTSY